MQAYVEELALVVDVQPPSVVLEGHVIAGMR
jgi:hypothetical protein